MNEFIVESKGRCFLCLNIISTDLGPSSSFQYLARYLHLDMRKVFHEGGHDISSKLLDKVQKAKIAVELCEVCAKLNSSFSVAYRQLEKIQLEVRSMLGLIHQRMLNNDTHKAINKLLSGMFVNECKSEGEQVVDELAAKLKIMDVLRNETMQKCSVKLNTTKPRVRVQRLTFDELLLIEKAKSKYESRQLANPGLETGPLIKTETFPSNMDPTSAWEEDHSFTGYDNDDLEYEPTNLIMKTEVEEKFCSNQIKPVVKRKLFAKGKSRQARVKCDICDKSFSRSSDLKRHELAIHTGKMFPCEQCDKQFNVRTNLNRHVKATHFGKMFYCDHCGKQFTDPANLDRHVKAIHLGKKFHCNYCLKKFYDLANLRRHVMVIHFNPRNLHKNKNAPKGN